MLGSIFRDASAPARIRHCYLSAFTDSYVAYLQKRGYAKRTIQIYVRAVEHFARWLERAGISPQRFSCRDVDLFLHKHLSRCRCHSPVAKSVIDSRAALKHLLVVAGRKFDTRPCGNATSAQIAATIDAYDRYLADLGGLSETTRQYRRRYVRELLEALFKRRRIDWDAITPAALVHYVTRRAAGLRPSSARAMALSLRSYLRFLRFAGKTQVAPPDAVPKIPNWSHSSLPEVLDEQQIKVLLNAFDRSRPVGRRDYAMARCLVDLGLRTCEVASLMINDIDWHRGTIEIARGKGQPHILPLLPSTGTALMEYLRNGRPPTTAHAVFVHHRAPLGQGVAPSTVRAVIRCAYRRAGLPVQRVHALRHSAATRMLRGGASLKDIADVLGHRCLDTTTIYAKVDIERLADVALPWPGRSA